MSLKRISILSLSLALLAGALPYHRAAAQSPEVKAARESVQKNVEKIGDEPNLKAAPQAETVESRRATIISILDLTLTELEDTLSEKKLGAVIKQSDVGLATIAKELAEHLLMYRGYVQLLHAQTARTDIGADELKAIAAGLKEWREGVYDPAMRQAFNTLLTMQGAEVLLTTYQRLERVNTDVKKIQAAAGVEANQLISMLEAARKNIASAAGYHADARELLLADEAAFLSATKAISVGAPHAATLRRGSAGDFICATGSFRGSECQLLFKFWNGSVYALRTQTGLPVILTPGDIASVDGVMLTVEPVFPGDGLNGLFFVQAINPAVSADRSTASFSATVVSMLGAITIAEAAPTPTVQSLIQKEIDEIGQAYKTFFTMSKLAKKLLNR